MIQHTNQQIASNYALWVEYFDTDGNMTKEEFDAMSVEARVKLLAEAFGPDASPKTPNETEQIDASEVGLEAAFRALQAAALAERNARAIYNALEESKNPDHAALGAASSALGDAVAAEDAARARYLAAVAAAE